MASSAEKPYTVAYKLAHQWVDETMRIANEGGKPTPISLSTSLSI
jgi:hypothetical protein